MAMPGAGPTVLFVSHDATRTGAPICLLHLLRWVTQHTNCSPIILLRRGGELTKEFEALAPTFCWSERWVFMNWRRVLRHLRLRRYLYPLLGLPLSRYLRSQNIRLIYSNTVTNTELSELFEQMGCSVITHVHELENAIRERLRPEDIQRLVRHTTHFIACCSAVKNCLIGTLGVAGNTIDVVHEFVPSPPVGSINKIEARKRIPLLHELQAGLRIVLGAGTTDWRKGPDLFVQLARHVIRERDMKDVHFVWIGGQTGDVEWTRLQHDVHKSRLAEHVHFIGTVTNAADYFAAADVFALTSREDPFPLVMLEAGIARTPTICFADAGGAPEFVGDDSGIVVPYLDLNAMADAVQTLLTDGRRRLQLGTRAEEKVRVQHAVSSGAARIITVMNRFCDNTILSST